MEQEIRNIMASVFRRDLSQIGEDASPDTIDTWDSLGHMKLIVALEDEFGVSFTDDEIPEMLNYKLVVATLRSKKSGIAPSAA